MRRKIALVGIGKIALDQHLPAIAGSSEWELAAAVSRNGRVQGVANFTTIEEMLGACADVAVVSLCLPPVPRFEYARQAIAAGRHVMLEKPPGATLAECHALEVQARQMGVSIFATWHSREAAMVPAAKKWLRGKRLNRLSVVWKEDVRRWHPGQDWVFEPGGLGVFDPGINALSIVTEILPDPIHVVAARLSIPENRQTPIAASLEYYHPHGAAVSIELDWRHEGDQTWTIEAETDAGVLRLTEGGARMTVNGEALADPAGVPLNGEYPRLYARMAQLVEMGESDFDLSPMVHVADAFVLGRHQATAPFLW